MASSSESRISSMSMKRPEPVGGVDGVLVLVFDFARGFSIGVDDAETEMGTVECNSGGFPRFFGEPSMVIGAEAGGLKIETGDLRICAEGGKSKSSISTKLCGDAGFCPEGGGSCAKSSMSLNPISLIWLSSLRNFVIGVAREVVGGGIGGSEDMVIGGGGSGGISSISMKSD